jgi:hypothetical protein
MKIFQSLHELRAEFGCSFLLVAHPRKTLSGDRGDRRLTMDDLFGTQAQQAQAGAIWLTQSSPQDSGSHVVLEQHKRRRNRKLLALRIDYASPDDSTITLSGHPVAHGATRGDLQRAKGHSNREAVAAALTDELSTVAEIQERCGITLSKVTVAKHAKDLVENGFAREERGNLNVLRYGLVSPNTTKALSQSSFADLTDWENKS